MARATTAKRRTGSLVENVKTIVYAGLIAIGIRTIAFEPFNIPSGSMIPTLLVGDYLFVSKYSYGYSRYSLPFSPPLFPGRLFGRLPHRGDVAVFKFPRDTSQDYIKRIIGLPGDRIQMKAGQLFINGALVPRSPIDDFYADDNGMRTMAKRYQEALPDGPKHDILKMTEQGDANNTPEYVVPEGRVFAMGDNRDNSADSRFLPPEENPDNKPFPSTPGGGVGYVPIENLVGRAEFIFLSVDGTAPLWQIWEWPFEIRWSRLFRGIT